MTEEKSREAAAAEALSSLGNVMCPDKKAFMELLHGEHRTIQQGIAGMMFAWVKDVANKYDNDHSRYFDLRNEQFGKTCSEINKAMLEKGHEYWEYMPCV